MYISFYIRILRNVYCTTSVVYHDTDLIYYMLHVLYILYITQYYRVATV